MRGQQKGIRQKISQVLKIPLGDGAFAYCQMVNSTEHAFFDYKDDGSSPIIEKILQSKMIFKCCIDSYVVNKGYWNVIGKAEIHEPLRHRPDKFSYNSFTNSYQIFKDGIGFVPATWEQVQNMEPFASWGHRAVEQRLIDHFAGRPCYFIEADRNEHRKDFPDIFTFYKKYGYDFKME